MPDSHIPQETPYQAQKKMSPAEQAEWQATRIRDTWRIFRIMGEFVEGFERLSEIGPSVSVFGSARTKPGSKPVATISLGVAFCSKYSFNTRSSWSYGGND